ncbi:MAG: NUDIX domain-containing protein [Verrucomicrobiota bacterium]
MPRESAGLLMFDDTGNELRVLVVHPGGPYYAKKDGGHWSIPKGEPNPGEEDLLEVARREFGEETGLQPPTQEDVDFWPLDTIQQKGGKIVHAWAFRGQWPEDHELTSNRIDIVWPPKSDRVISIPEVDRAEMATIERARELLKETQHPLLDRLVGLLGRNPT